jgi:hypothetical protein
MFFTFTTDHHKFQQPKELIVRSVMQKKKSKVRMLGYDKPLKWSLIDDGSVRFEIPRRYVISRKPSLQIRLDV